MKRSQWRSRPAELVTAQRWIAGGFLLFGLLIGASLFLTKPAKIIFRLAAYSLWVPAIFGFPIDRAKRSYILRSGGQAGIGEGWFCSVKYSKEGQTLGFDEGALAFTSGLLMFVGLQTQFALSADLVQLRPALPEHDSETAVLLLHDGPEIELKRQAPYPRDAVYKVFDREFRSFSERPAATGGIVLPPDTARPADAPWWRSNRKRDRIDRSR